MGDGASVRSATPKKIKARVVGWAAKADYNRSHDKAAPPIPKDTLLAKTKVARMLNRLNGCSTFTAWNIDQLPSIDLEEIAMTLKYIEEINGG